MRILIVTHYFPPEIGAPQARLSEFARLWAEAGDEVVVLTGMPNHPTGIVPEQYRRRAVVLERSESYRIVRTWLYATANEGTLRKTIGHLSFAITSVGLGCRRTGAADVVVVSSPTFFSIFAAWRIARKKQARLVVEVRDLWPAIFVELGVLKNRLLVSLLERAELMAYRAADAIVVVSDGFRQNLNSRGVPLSKMHTIPNGVDVDRFTSEAGSEARRRLGTTDSETLVLYAGAHGISHGLTAVAEAAGELESEGIRFAFVGDGAAKADLVRRVSELGLSNVVTLPSVPRQDMPGLLAAADICLVPLRDIPLFESFIPSKMFEFLAAEKAVIGTLRGEAAEILGRAGAVVVPPEDTGALVGAIRSLAVDRDRRASMGREGRRFVTEHFERRTLAGRYRSMLHELLGEP